MTWRSIRRDAREVRLNAGLVEQYQKRKKRPVPQWAPEVRIIPAGGSVVSNGYDMRYSHDLMPHLISPMEAADNPNIRKIVLWFGIREGKTNGVCMNVVGRTVTDDPGNIYSVHPTDQDAEKFSNDDVEPTIEACLEDYFVAKKGRDSGRTIEYKRFRGGSIRIFSAGSITKFRGTSVKVLLLHELDALNSESIFKAFGRTTGFGDAIIILESTCTLSPLTQADGTLKYRSNIQQAYEEGDMQKWFCACRKCGALQWLKYKQIATLERKAGETHFYLCERCDTDHNGKQWRKMAAGGIWYPTAGLSELQIQDIERTHKLVTPIDPTVRSYWRSGFNSLLPVGKGYKTKLDEFVGVHDSMCRTLEGKKTWANEIAAEVWNPEQEEAEPAPEWEPLFNRREGYNPGDGNEIILPERCLVLTAGVDVQKDRLEVQWIANGRNEETWVADYVVIPGEVQDMAIWKELATELSRKFKHESGAELRIGSGFVDGGKWPEWILRFLQYLMTSGSAIRGKVKACRGSSNFPHPLVERAYSKLAKTLKGHWVGGDAAKDLIYQRLRMSIGENGEIPEGWIHFGESLGEKYFQQLTAEQVTIAFTKQGEEIRRYLNENHVRNEALDTFVYALAAFHLKRWNFDEIEREMKESVKPIEQLETPESGRRRKRRGGWMSI